MDSPQKFYFRVAGEVRGPATAEQLHGLASVSVVTPETEIAPTTNGPWAPLSTATIYAKVFPERPAMGFKANEFKTLNGDAAPAVAVDAIKDAATQIPSSFRGREVIVTKRGEVRGTLHGEPLNEVQEMVLEVGRRVAANAPPEVLRAPPPRFPQWRLYVAGAVIGTAFMLCIPLFYPDRESDVFTFSILGGWIVLYNGFLAIVASMDWGMRRLLSRRKITFDVRRDE